MFQGVRTHFADRQDEIVYSGLVHPEALSDLHDFMAYLPKFLSAGDIPRLDWWSGDLLDLILLGDDQFAFSGGEDRAAVEVALMPVQFALSLLCKFPLRDVNVQAIDGGGRVLSAVSVDNPREVHTAGARDPDTAVLPMATFTVFFADPLEIRVIEVAVVKGANSGLKQSIDVEPRSLKEFDVRGP